MKVGILTYHRAYNYGAYLQACALCNRLNLESDIDAEIIDFQMYREKKHYEVKYYPLKRKLHRIVRGTYFFEKTIERCFKKALNDPVMKKSEDYLLSDSIWDFQGFVDGKYDVIIAGSDEIWKMNNFRGFPSPYWLFGNLHCKKMAYAASSRVNFRDELSVSDYEKMQNALEDFCFIGVRDSLTYKEVYRAIHRDDIIHMCCDPSFLFDFNLSDADVMKRLSRKMGYKKNRKTVLVMLDDNYTAKQIRKSLRKYNLVSVYKPHRGYINFAEIEPLEWLSLIKNSDFIIASFFHAICFSIIYNKPFLAVGTNNKKSKLIGVLDDPRLEERYIDIDSFFDLEGKIKKIYHSNADFSSIVENKRKSFDVFLKELRD